MIEKRRPEGPAARAAEPRESCDTPRMARREKEPFTRPRRQQFWAIVFAVIWSFAVVTLWGAYRHVYHASPSGIGSARHEVGGLRWLLVLEDNVTQSGTAPPGVSVTRASRRLATRSD